MRTSYHNTNKLHGKEYIRANLDARTLEDQILAWMKKHKGKYTPIHVWRTAFPNKLLTSVRRALSNLVDSGELKDTTGTGEKRNEIFGKPNYLWYYPRKK